MVYYGITDKGIVRDQNQDGIYILKDSRFMLYIIADGMGGANAGDVASQIAIDSARKYVVENYTDQSDTKIKDLLKEAIYYANEQIFNMSLNDDRYEGMGTTLILVLQLNNKIYIGHVGDSSVYRIRKDIIRKITKDHSYVQKLVDDKSITKREAKTHPKRNMLLKAVGCDEQVEPDVMVKKIEADDYILLCTDGLTNMLKDKEIIMIIKSLKDCKSICEKLVEVANSRGGYDNISIILIHKVEV